MLKKCHRRHNYIYVKICESHTFWKSENLGPTILMNEQNIIELVEFWENVRFFQVSEKNSKTFKNFESYSIYSIKNSIFISC